MNTPSRLWVRVSLLASVVFLIPARRNLETMPSLARALTILGVAVFLGGLGAQAWRWTAAKGKRRQSETTLLACYLGVLVAGLMYFLTTKGGLGLVGMAEAAPRSLARYDVVMTIGWVLVGACSLLPAVFMEATVGEWTADDPDDAVEFQRVREMGLSGLTIALAAALMMVTCNVAKQKNIRKDVSYFKTSAPGDSTRKIVESMKAPVRVLLFFPEVNEVGEEVEGYFKELARRTGKVTIERHDRLVSAQLAQKYQVQKDGTVVLVRASDDPKATGADAEKSGKFDVDTDFDRARRQTGKLRVLDQTVNSELLKLVREKRKAYLTVGHAELNDPDSLPVAARGRYPDAKSVVIKAILGQLNYEVKTLPTMDLNREVPADATIVMVLGPKTRFEPGELTALTAYLDRGGRLLVAVDPMGEFELGPLAGYFGVTVDRHIIHDDRNYTPERGQPTDKMLALTNGFSSHPATTALSRGSANQAILLQTAGALVERDFDVPGSTEKPKRTIIIRSMSDSWLDLDGNHSFDGATEKRDRYPVGAAVEGPKRKDADGADAEGWRALVFSDNDLFADRLFQTLTGQKGLDTNSRTLPDDGIRWLGGEEAFAGIVNNEKENEVRQTKKQQALWFLATTLVVPIMVFGLGLAYALSTRRRRPLAPAKMEKTS
ncbi:MAG: Gldg family protein [Myxococcales bacterium]|nr:Gldg family protein [Myxococcales bacterium]